MSSEEKVTRVLVVAPLGVGGVTNMMINIQKNIDRTKVNFDYLTFHDRKEPSEDIVKKMGSKKYVASVDNIRIAPLRRIARLKEIKKVCKDNKIKILHYNADTAADLMNIIAAKAGGVEYVTIHSHNAGFGVAGKGVRLVSRIMKPFISKYCNNYWGCSDLAARFLFPKSIIESKQYAVLPNGIDLNKYKFDKEIREQTRIELKLDGKFVVGHAGRFAPQKNHSFLLDIFKEVHDMNSNSVLLLFGVGELMDKMKEKAKQLGIEKDVIFYGATNEMDKMWQAMDVFLMPSLHEGLPVTGIEAQASGLPCIFSNEITSEVDVTGKSMFLPLSDPPKKWAETVLSINNFERHDNVKCLAEAGYDISSTAKIVEELYCKADRK